MASEQLQRKVSLTSSQSAGADDSETKSIREEIISQEIRELELGEVELFDDYLEMIMTYGYITLFASAFPFGTTLTAVFIYIEIRSDVFKLEKLSRRPFSHKTSDIGTWMFALKTLTFGSIFTNLVLCGFASDQIDQIFPYLKNYRDFSLVSYLTMFAIEHVIIVIVLVYLRLFDCDPLWVTTYHRRKTYKMLKKQAQ